MDLTTAIQTLPTPHCPEDLGTNCPGITTIDPATGKELVIKTPFERVTGESRPGELDVTVRCHYCQACAHYTLDSSTGQILDADALSERRQASGVRRQAPTDNAPLESRPSAVPASEPGLNVSPAPEHGETTDEADGHG